MCQFIHLFLLLIVCSTSVKTEDDDSKLLSFVQLFRHGARTPVMFFKDDPYKNVSYWGGLGRGQLTKEGKQQLVELGRLMRRRYHDFIPENYSAGFFKLNSDTNKRNIESMQKYLQGLYPSITESQYDINIDSSILKAFISPTFILQYLKLTVTSAKFRSFMKEHKKLFKYLLEYGKLDVPFPERLAHSYVVYDVLTTEERNNLTLPEWTKSVFPENVTELARAFGKTMGYNRKMQKHVTVGPFLNVLVDHFDKISNQSTEERILLFSGHDINLMCLLNTFDVFDQFEYDVPAFANSIIFEMREKDGKHFINGYYRILDHPDLYPITFKGCAFDCDYREFKERLAVVRMNYKLLNRYNLDVTTETFSKTSLYQSLERLF